MQRAKARKTFNASKVANGQAGGGLPNGGGGYANGVVSSRAAIREKYTDTAR